MHRLLEAIQHIIAPLLVTVVPRDEHEDLLAVEDLYEDFLHEDFLHVHQLGVENFLHVHQHGVEDLDEGFFEDLLGVEDLHEDFLHIHQLGVEDLDEGFFEDPVNDGWMVVRTADDRYVMLREDLEYETILSDFEDYLRSVTEYWIQGPPRDHEEVLLYVKSVRTLVDNERWLYEVIRHPHLEDFRQHWHYHFAQLWQNDMSAFPTPWDEETSDFFDNFSAGWAWLF